MNYLRITIADNGLILQFDDPKVRERNRTSEGWSDPERQRVYATPEALIADLTKLLPLLETTPPSEAGDYETAIAEAFSKEEGN